MAQTSIVRTNGVRDSTEEKAVQNYAAEYAKRLVEKEAAERKAADEALGTRITNHANETATDKKSSHVFLSDEIDSTLNASTGKTAATPYAVKQVNDALKAEAEKRDKEYTALDSRIKQEASDREAGDTALGKRIDKEAEDRYAADTVLGGLIDKEVNDRINGDTALGGRIDALDGRLETVEGKAHTHDNKDVLDAIDADRVRKWDDGSEGQITLGEYLEHLAESERQFDMLWELLGMTVYDGGWFGMAQLDAPLDGGDFEGTEFTPLDCGGFEPYVIPSGGIGTVVDGGTY